MSPYDAEIDRLLESYLLLLDQYTRLRDDLSKAHAATMQHLARANFSAERGMRYGEVHYDERMRASRGCRVVVGKEGGARVEVLKVGGLHGRESAEEDRNLDGKGVKTKAEESEESTEEDEKLNEKDFSAEPEEFGEGEPTADSRESKEDHHQPKDPINMFGILTPPSLRLAQKQSITTIETIIPRLISTDAQMKDLEIRIRRAKKYRAKADIVASRGGSGG